MHKKIADLESIMTSEPYLTASKSVNCANMPLFTRLITIGTRIQSPIFILAVFQIYKVVRQLIM